MRPLLVAALALLALAGCNAEERGHVVRLDKGGYAGLADTTLSDATRLILRQRVAWLGDGPAEVAVMPGMAATPSGNTAPIGRIAGQNY